MTIDSGRSGLTLRRRRSRDAPLERAALVLAWAPLPMAVLSFGVSIVEPRMLFAAFGFTGLFAVTWPYVIPRFRTMRELLSSWGFLVASVVVGVTTRGTYMALGLPDEETLNTLFFRSQPDSFFYGPAAVMVVSLALMSVGYIAGARRQCRPLRLVRHFEGYEIDPKRLRAVVACLAVLALLAFLRFAHETGGLDLLAPSAKRATAPGLSIEPEHRGLGYLRLTGTLAAMGYLVTLAYFVKARLPMLPWRLPLLTILFVNSGLISFYASSRADIVWLLLMSLAVVYLVGRKVSVRAVVTIVVLALLIVHVMGSFRSVRGDLERVDFRTFTSVMQVTDSLVLNRNLVDMSKTAHVIHAVPEVLDWKYGTTITGWLVAPIPRELWPGKPLVQSGPEVGVLVYGQRSGVPPGFVAEMYWNTHLVGVVVGSLLLGLLLRVLHGQLYPRNVANLAWVLLYVVGTLRIGVFVLGTSAAQGVVMALAEVVLLYGVLWLVADRACWRPQTGTLDRSRARRRLLVAEEA